MKRVAAHAKVGAPRQTTLSRAVWAARYRHTHEHSVADSWLRVARTLAAAEPRHRERYRRQFRAALQDFKFLPGGRILAGAGTGKSVTLANCFVTDTLSDSLDVLFERLKESATTMQWGGGIGCDFSPLRPRGADAPGPVAYMRIWDAMCESLSSIGARRGAMMGALRCDHPDIEAFIRAKRVAGQFRNFNLSVLVTDDFMRALARNERWSLCFPNAETRATGAVVERAWPGHGGRAVCCSVVGEVPARQLWQTLMETAYDSAEPGVLFIDRLNAENNLHYCEELVATNPCGEVPLPRNGACHLGSMNLTTFVREPFSPSAVFDYESFAATAVTAVRMLDDTVDASAYPLAAQAEQARATRRIGLGVTGLADALMMLNLRYDDDAGRAAAARMLECLRDAAYGASTDMAAEKGSFPRFARDAFLAGAFVSRLPAGLRDKIARHGIRNSHLLAIAPAGTISLLANNVSSGIEPAFALEGRRRVAYGAAKQRNHAVTDFAYALWRDAARGRLPRAFVTAAEIPVEAHLSMLAALTPFVDNSISKTINVPADVPRAEFMRLYERAYELGVKGCTVFRPNALRDAVLTAAPSDCCSQGGRAG